jgi:predicted RNA polymerase sigma factor
VLALVEQLAHEPALKNYHLLGSVRGDLLHKLGRFDEARAAFEAAAELAGNRREQESEASRGGGGLPDPLDPALNVGLDWRPSFV